MNRQRRTKANEALLSLRSALACIELLLDAEQTALEGIPENMCQRVELCEDTLSALEDAKISIEEAIAQLEAAINH